VTAKFALYGQSKLANVVYASQLAKHYPKITTAAIHPGVIWTGLADHLGMLERIVVKVYCLALKHLSVQEGAYNTLWAATSMDKSALQSGGVYEPVGKPVSPTKQSADKALAEELWKWTETELAAYS
jgi:NAD(P)-dependent dehydrogenase (short-subunit alcohol dehydrogenase family)